jgi:hypothetical protein
VRKSCVIVGAVGNTGIVVLPVKTFSPENIKLRLLCNDREDFTNNFQSSSRKNLSLLNEVAILINKR